MPLFMSVFDRFLCISRNSVSGSFLKMTLGSFSKFWKNIHPWSKHIFAKCELSTAVYFDFSTKSSFTVCCKPGRIIFRNIEGPPLSHPDHRGQRPRGMLMPKTESWLFVKRAQFVYFQIEIVMILTKLINSCFVCLELLETEDQSYDPCLSIKVFYQIA